MRQGTPGRRNNGRGRHQHNVQNQGHGRRPQGGTLNRNSVLDSIGPDVKIRGTATQIYEKYASLAREAQGSGDRVLAESYYQHADHYFRLLSSFGIPQESITRRQDEYNDYFTEETEQPQQQAAPDQQPAVPNNGFVSKNEDQSFAPSRRPLVRENDEQPDTKPSDYVDVKQEQMNLAAERAAERHSRGPTNTRRPRPSPSSDTMTNTPPETTSASRPAPNPNLDRKGPDSRRRRPSSTQGNLFENETKVDLDRFDTIPDFLKGDDDLSNKPSRDFFLLDDEDEKI